MLSRKSIDFVVFHICIFIWLLFWCIIALFFSKSSFSFLSVCIFCRGTSRPWSHGSWIYNYPCNQSVSPLMLRVRISIRTRCTTLCDKVCQWLATGRWFSPGPPVSSTNKTDRYDITEILLKVENTIKQTNLHLLIIL
jgi:hypothetical protein